MSKQIIAGTIALIVIGLAATFFAAKYNATSPLPASLVLQIPFSPQAPNNNWDRNEDCEETSITMANAYLTGSTENILPVDAAQQAINNLKKWEQANLGYNADTGADATTRMAQGAFGLKIKQIMNFTEQDLKKELADHHPILLPINAKLLANAQYRNSGPQYHMIVLRGYSDNGFIVNDPGTDGGNGNIYPFSLLQNAAADWNHVTKKMEANRKIALVVSK